MSEAQARSGRARSVDEERKTSHERRRRRRRGFRLERTPHNSETAGRARDQSLRLIVNGALR